MSRFLTGIAALTLAGAALMPIQASAAERHAGVTTEKAVTSTDISTQRRHWRHRHYARPYYYGPRYRSGYYGYPGPYYYGGYPYGYYRPAPFVGFGVGPFGFRVF
jgi:hypothetical protein